MTTASATLLAACTERRSVEWRLFFLQGVVTKVGIHITPAPEACTACELRVPNERDLPQLVEILAGLQRRGVITNHPSISNVFLQAILSPDDAVKAKLVSHFGPSKTVPESVLDQLKSSYGWGFWKAEFGLQDDADVVPTLESSLRLAITKIPRAQLQVKPSGGTPGKFLRAGEVETRGIPHNGVPSLEALSLMDYRLSPGSGHTDFSPVVTTSGQALFEWYLAAKEMVSAAKFDFFSDFHAYSQYIIPIVLVVYAPEEKERANKLCQKLIDDAVRRGLTTYRTHAEFMDQIRSHSSFNGHALTKLVDSLKATMDPNNILSPAKSGIKGTKQTSFS
ncbi:Vanillyl-alcohol oxidase [Fusarium oxysporum f. sp. rapae]|uniref:Vanillyl-alcohol oxidase n=1 Tax=Fusarium oxysporum f. sp. rapae TaxID=485398 RepID=A0A8J5NR19_FUSOX|nr:Vanillyl-alcohol oxidase [Fusarium oxysporum f. sp. rapae]